MLFLSGQSSPTPNDIPKTDLNTTLSKVFDIRLGLVEDRYLHLTEDGKEPVYFVGIREFSRMYDRRPNTRYMDWNQANPLTADWRRKLKSGDLLKEQTMEKNNDTDLNIRPKSLVNTRFILQPLDYLISTRGFPQGFSMLNVPEVKEFKLVPASLFIRLRPKSETGYRPGYLHLILELMVEQFLTHKFLSKQTDNLKLGKSYAAFNSVNKKDIRELPISLHTRAADQDTVLSSFKEYYHAKKQAARNLIEFRSQLKKTILK